MTNHGDGKKPHFLLGSISETEPFRKPPTKIKSKLIPERDRNTHGAKLLAQLQSLMPRMETAKNIQEEAGLEGGFGLQVEFEGFPDVQMAFERLDRVRSGIELLNVRQEDNRTSATVFVPDGKLADFEKLITAYLEERRDRIGRPRDNKTLINSIQSIRAATIRALWTDDEAVFPTEDNETFWWEVWLPVRQDRKAEAALFRRLAEAQGFNVASGELDFPERTVLLVYGSTLQMKQSMMTLNSIAELRRAKETADFFDALPPQEQGDWLNDLLERTQAATSEETVPHVCLLDTGVNNGHPLIAPSLDLQDMHTVEPGWGIEDLEGHGTSLAGLSLFGDLTEILDSNNPVEIKHRLESVKLLPTDGTNEGDSIHHGYLTTEAVSRPEITAPHRHRVFSMAVTAKDGRDRGRPSAWSAALDRLAVDADGNGATQRLLMVSAGNIQDLNAWALYPDSNSTDGIHDPGQSWNALTVGAFTELVQITETDAEEYEPIAKAGGLSPFSTTSYTWDRKWPLKPDIVFEGGNAAKNALGAVWMPSLSLLTSHHAISDKFFTTANATSAATALASRMAAQLHGGLSGSLAGDDTCVDRSFRAMDT